jgi:hypothetical protein
LRKAASPIHNFVKSNGLVSKALGFVPGVGSTLSGVAKAVGYGRRKPLKGRRRLMGRGLEDDDDVREEERNDEEEYDENEGNDGEEYEGGGLEDEGSGSDYEERSTAAAAKFMTPRKKSSKDTKGIAKSLADKLRR